MRSHTHRQPALQRKPATWIFILPIVLSIFGLFFVFEASSIRAFQEYSDSFRFLKLQTVWIFLGIGALIFFSLIDYHKWYYLSFLMMGGTVLLLVMVLIPGIGSTAGGARRWIDLGFFSIQPTEFAKFATIIYLSSWFVERTRKRFFSFLLLLGLLMGLILLQPDMGTAIIIFLLSVTMYYLAGHELRYLLMLMPVAAVGGWILIHISPYRFKRLLAFFDPSLDPLGITYHITQILISLTNGGLFGQGFGASRQKYLFLPEAHTDSIFAIIGEEIGFVGSIALISVFIILIYQLYLVHQHTKDRFGKLLIGGIMAFFSYQAIVNLAAMVNLVPLTGVPLPFISYGGSHILVSFALLGIAINIAKK